MRPLTLSQDYPVLVFGGVYSNLQALQELKAYADAQGIPAQQCICTGDLLAYAAEPLAVVELMRQWGALAIMGNCEQAFASKASDCGCGFSQESQCQLLSQEWFGFTQKQLTPSARQWLATLAPQLLLQWGRYQLAVVHGSVTSINEFIFSSTCEAILVQQFQQVSADLILAGHSGLPFTRQLACGTWHNSGALGMPANDGTPRTWFSVLHLQPEGLCIKKKSLSYDHQAAYQAMQKAKRSTPYADTLLHGRWPSMDCLPDALKACCGIPQEEATIILGSVDVS